MPGKPRNEEHLPQAPSAVRAAPDHPWLMAGPLIKCNLCISGSRIRAEVTSCSSSRSFANWTEKNRLFCNKYIQFLKWHKQLSPRSSLRWSSDLYSNYKEVNECSTLERERKNQRNMPCVKPEARPGGKLRSPISILCPHAGHFQSLRGRVFSPSPVWDLRWNQLVM